MNIIGPLSEMWMDLETVILSEESQNRKTDNLIISLVCEI